MPLFLSSINKSVYSPVLPLFLRVLLISSPTYTPYWYEMNLQYRNFVRKPQQIKAFSWTKLMSSRGLWLCKSINFQFSCASSSERGLWELNRWQEHVHDCTCWYCESWHLSCIEPPPFQHLYRYFSWGNQWLTHCKELHCSWATDFFRLQGKRHTKRYVFVLDLNDYCDIYR